ncbi:uncharacterized protein LOC9640244 [Selaginella moellendorffii]|nr:uncharacterized protein LOC9640244 [Selaginella moellendorffii]|eukprot:XP_002971718.2 uncharacterized protein LOC9640244 [Selaginella moellendorffii]
MELALAEERSLLSIPLSTAEDGRSIVPAPEVRRCFTRRKGPRPEVQAYTVQCSRCGQWRLVPSEEVYESIRARVLENPWVCEDAKIWRPDACCDIKGDIQQEGDDRLWALDKPNLPKTPAGWKRDFVIRSEGCSRFGDIYYISPCGKKLRSMVEVAKFLEDHPEYYDLSVDQFCYTIPQPADKSYVAGKKRARDSPSKLVLQRCVRQSRNRDRSARALNKKNGSRVPQNALKPSLKLPPPVPRGWIREIILRGSGSSRLCDVYYLSPCQARIRSLPDMNEFLHQNPSYLHQGVRLEQFDFGVPASEREIFEVGSLPGCAVTRAMKGSNLRS